MTELNTENHAAAQLNDVLYKKVTGLYGTDTKVKSLTKLSAGASRETWSFDVAKSDGTVLPLILKRDPVNYLPDGSIAPSGLHMGVDRETEGRLVALAVQAGLPAPQVPFYLEESDVTTAGFVMERLEGETLGRRILRNDTYADARTKLAFQCGHAAAKLHSIPLADLPTLTSLDAREHLDLYQQQLRSIEHPYPGFEYGFRWLEERVELAGDNYSLVHGDFRNGNIIVGEEGLRAVLDWELAHLGNPLSDLGWICVPSWRYGHMNKPVGGFGDIEDMLAGYEAGGGGQVSTEAIRYWVVFGTLRWGIMCVQMGFSHIDGPHHSLEKAAIGRRTAETEYDLLQLVD